MSGMHKKEKGAEKENRKLTFGLWTSLCVCCMAVMLHFAANKTIVIADAYQEQTGLPVNASTEGHGLRDTALCLKQTYGTAGSFSVPLPKSVKAENLGLENHYMDRELWIYIQSDEAFFYEQNEIFGDVSPIQSGCSEIQEDGILLKFQMDHVMEYKSTMEGNTLTIACYEPDELYEFIVVLDPEAGGRDEGAGGANLSEKDLTLQVARLVQKKLTTPDVRLYLTRTEDVEVSEQDRIGLTEAVKADFYIRLGAESDMENPGIYGIQSSYNEEYFIPDFGNANLADVVTKAVTIASSNRAVGLFCADEDSILKALKTRGVRLSLGYLSNPQEELLLGQDVYQEKLADGIVNAIAEACDTLR